MSSLVERLRFVAVAEHLGDRTPSGRPGLHALDPDDLSPPTWARLVAELDDLGADPRPDPPSCGADVSLAHARQLLRDLPAPPASRAEAVAEFGCDLDRRAAALDGSRARRDRGAFYTPAGLADMVLERALAVTTTELPRVLDPACGTGAFLLPAAAHLGPSRLLTHVRGIDLDPLAVEVCRLRLWLWADNPDLAIEDLAAVVTWGDALAADAPSIEADLVVGNPPFRTRLRRSTAGDGEQRRARFGDLAQPYTDDAALFLIDAVDRCADGGCVAFVQPLATLAADHAGRARAHIAARAELLELWLDDGSAFDAGVTTCVPLLGVGHPRPSSGVVTSLGLPPRSTATSPSPPGWRTGARWSTVAAGAFDIPTVHLDRTSTLGDLCDATADFRDQYYGLVGAVVEGDDDPAHARLITAGLIDPAWCAWGRRPTRFAGTTFDRPVVDLGALDPTMAAWAAKRGVPKLLVATQTPVIEVVVDVDGRWLPSVPVLTVVPRPGVDLWLLAAALGSPVATAWAAANLVGTALAPGAITLRASTVGTLPAPVDPGAWQAGADALRAAAAAAADDDPERWRAGLDHFGEAMAGAYGDANGLDEARSWWSARLPVDPTRRRRGGAGPTRRARLAP